MVKNKALPDSSRLSAPLSGHSLSLSFSLSPSQTCPYQGWSHVSSLSLSRRLRSSRGYPLDPAEAGPRQVIIRYYYSICQFSSGKYFPLNYTKHPG